MSRRHDSRVHCSAASKRRRSIGFTLLELLVTMAIIAILATVAVFSIHSSRSRRAMEEFTSNISYTLREARSRATANGTRYAVQITPLAVRWCQTDCPPNQPNTPGLELGQNKPAVNGAEAVKFAKSADLGNIAMPTTTTLSTITVYFNPDGTFDSDITTVDNDGFTIYLQHKLVKSLKYRVAILPLSADIRTYDNWGY